MQLFGRKFGIICIEGNVMSEKAKIAEFVAFCIEMYAKARHISGAAAASMFEKFGAIGYLVRGYEVLHTMGEEWLVADVEDYLKARGCVA